MQRILGIDPGLVATGYAAIESDGRASRLIASGVISARGGSVPERLGRIFEGVGELIREHRPEAVSIENVFVHKDATAALKLGQAHGAAVVAAVTNGVAVHEYAARAVKKAVVGRGGAGKEQVQFMVARLLQVAARHKDDETDAMAIALCHAFTHAGEAQRARLSAASPSVVIPAQAGTQPKNTR